MKIITVTPQDKVAVHSGERTGNYIGKSIIVVGTNPVGERGGQCGNWIDGKAVFEASHGTKKLAHAKAKIDEALTLAKKTGQDQTVNLD
jgi:hypothetical protein